MENNEMMHAWPPQKLAVVIGAGGMGMAIARRLGQQYRLLLADLNQQKLEQQAARLQDEGIQVDTVQCDVTNPESAAHLAATVKKMGDFRVLAHVAGLSPSMADWQTIMTVNLVGPILVSNALLPFASPGTAAVIISSLAAHMTSPDTETQAILSDPLAIDFIEKLEANLGEQMTTQMSYMLSKYEINRVCERLSVAWGQKGARINSLSPGLIATPMGIMEFKNQPMKYKLLEKTPLQRQGGMHEITDAVEFLVSDKASFISGTNLLVDGGIAAALKHGGIDN